MTDLLCPLCAVVVDTYDDATQTVNSFPLDRSGVVAFLWEVRNATTQVIVRPVQTHEC